MTKAHRLKTRKSNLPLAKGVPINFLLGCSDLDLGNYELARLTEVAERRKQIQLLHDQIVEQTGLAWLAAWFRSMDRSALKHAIENEESPLEWAQRMICEGQRSEQENQESIPQPPLPPGAAHLAAALRYQQRNLAQGLCVYCPQPLDRNSVRFCTKHLALERHRSARKAGVKGEPGSADYLYGEITESTHGRQPGTLRSLEMHREQKTRAVLAEQGIPPESAAVSLKAAIEALLKCMPHSKADAITQAQLFEKAGVVTKTTGQKALQQLLYTGEIKRIGKGGPLDLYRYFQEQQNAPTERLEKSGEEPTENRKSKHLSRTKQNSALLKTMRGEEGEE